MTALETYIDFIIDYAPYLFYIPGTGVDLTFGRGVSSAAFSIDFLIEAYNSGKFPTKETAINTKIIALADWILTQQCTNNAKDAYKSEPNTVGTSTTYSATRYPFQRKAFFANGRFWVFWGDGANTVYATSLDGVAWTPKTTLHDYWCDYGQYFSVVFDGTYFHYAFSDHYAIIYRRGLPNADGSITWSAAEQTVHTTFDSVNYPSISVDSNGYVWIAYRDITDGNEFAYVIKSGNNDGTWGTTPGGFPYKLNEVDSSLWRLAIVSLTDGKMVVIYGYGGMYHLRARRWDGAAWGDEAQASLWSTGYNYFSAVPDGDDALIVCQKGNKDIYFLRYSYATNSFVDTTKIQSDTVQTSAPVLSRDPTTGDLYCFWAGAPAANHIYYKKRVGTTWDADPTDWIDESSEVLTDYDRLTCFYNSYGGNIGLLYVTKTASPYNVRFAYLTSLKAYGGFKSNENSDYYYSIDACRVIPSLLRAYEFTEDSDYLDAAKLAGFTFLKTMQDKQSYGGFAKYVDINNVWDLKLDVECLYGLIGLKMLAKTYDTVNATTYETIMIKAVTFLRSGFENIWLYYDPSDSSWHRVGLSENEIYDDPLAYALIGLYDYEGWSLSCQKTYTFINSIPSSADYPGYNARICWTGYIDVIKRKAASNYYDAVTSGILQIIRKSKDEPSLKLSYEIVTKYYLEFMFWGVKYVDWSPVENKQSPITVSWLGLLLLRYQESRTRFARAVKKFGDTLTLYSLVKTADAVAYTSGISIKAVVNVRLPDEVMLEPGYTITDFIMVHTFVPIRHNDKIRRAGIDYEVAPVQIYRFRGEPISFQALCRRLLRP